MLFENTLSTSGLPFLISLQNQDKTFINHYHKEAEILYVLKGEMNIYSYGGNSKLTAGDIMFIPPYIEHAVLPFHTKCERIAILLDVYTITTFLSGIINMDSIQHPFDRINGNSHFWKQTAYDKISSIIHHTYDEYISRQSGWECVVLSMFLQLFTIVLRELPLLEQAPDKAKEIRTIQNALEYISNNYAEEISLNTCALAVGLNSSYFSRLFHHTIGISFHDYVTQLRIEKAKWLLRYTNHYIIDISLRSGFQNVKTFNYVFKAKTGLTPKQYRNN